MSFIQNLRMNNLLSPDGSALNGMAPPDFHAGGPNLDMISGLINRITPYLSSERQKDRNLQLNLHGMENPDGMSTRPLGHTAGPMMHPTGVMGSGMMAPGVGQATPPQNVVFKDNSLTPYEKASLAQKDKELNEKKSEAGAKLGFNYSKLGADVDSRTAKQSLSEWKAKNPQGKIVYEPGGNIHLINPITGETTDTGIESGKMSDRDKMELAGSQKLDQIGAKGSETRKNIGVRGAVAMQEIGAKGEEARKTKGTPGAQNTLPTQTRVDQFNKAQEVFNTDPELKQFIKLNPDKTFEIEPPSTGFFGNATGPSLEQFSRIKAKIYGSSTPVTDKAGAGSPKNNIPAPKSDAAGDDKFKVDATKILKDAGKPITDANIQHVVDQLKKQGGDDNENDNNDDSGEE
jgi:hypothetical protein